MGTSRLVSGDQPSLSMPGLIAEPLRARVSTSLNPSGAKQSQLALLLVVATAGDNEKLFKTLFKNFEALEPRRLELSPSSVFLSSSYDCDAECPLLRREFDRGLSRSAIDNFPSCGSWIKRCVEDFFSKTRLDPEVVLCRSRAVTSDSGPHEAPNAGV